MKNLRITKKWVGAVADRADDIQQLLKFAQQLDSGIKTDGVANALQQVEDGAKQLEALLDTANSIWHTFSDLAVDPRSLAIVGHVFVETLPALEKKFH